MKSKKIISLITAITVTASLLLASTLNVFAAEQTTQNLPATQTATANRDVTVNLTDDKIQYGTLDIPAQILANGYERTDKVKYVIFESQNDIKDAGGNATPDSIAFNEGVTNTNAFYRINSTGQIYPTGSGLDSGDWIYFRDATSGTAYVKPQLKVNLSNGGGGVTMPGAGTVTEVGSAKLTQDYYTSADSGVTWTRHSQDIYVALGSDAKLYVSNTAALSGTQFYSAKGEGRADPFNNGNTLVLTSPFPTTATSEVILDFGYNIPWNSTQNGVTKSLYTLIDMPQHAAAGHEWTWTLNVTGEWVSNP